MKARSRFLTSALIWGCLDNTNLVNAKSVARSAGFEVQVSLCEGVEGVTVCEGGRKVGGTVLGNSPVLTTINESSFNNFPLSGTLVVTMGTSLEQLTNSLELSLVKSVSGCVCIYVNQVCSMFK